MAIEHQDILKIAAHHRFQWEEADQIVNALKEKFKDVDGIEKDILSMIQFALDKAWIEKAN